jgi:light-regulated signal transduction histidine kinase (bacteriophytochrome)
VAILEEASTILPKTLSQKSLSRLFLWGLALIPLAIISDAILGAVLFDQGAIVEQILSPSYYQIAIRFLFSVFILAAIYLGMHYLADTAQREKALMQSNQDLDLTRKDIEDFNHDLLQHLRNTSSEISTSMALLKAQCDSELEEKTRYFLESIANCNEKLSRQLDTSLALVELPVNQPRRERIKVDKLALEIKEELGHKHPEREIEFRIQPWVTIVSDRQMIRLVLHQLFCNAMAFIPENRKGWIELGMYHRGEQKVLFVRDNGTGFSEGQAKRLFEAFRDSSQDGNLPTDTIRLAGAQRIIHRLGGQIWAEGAEGAGGTIYFTYCPAKA